MMGSAQSAQRALDNANVKLMEAKACFDRERNEFERVDARLQEKLKTHDKYKRIAQRHVQQLEKSNEYSLRGT